MNALRNTMFFLILYLSSGFVFGQDSVTVNLNHRKTGKAMIVPAIFLTAGFLSISEKYAVRNKRNDQFPNFSTKVDNYLQYTPIVAAYSSLAAGVHGKNDLANETAILIKSELLMGGIVTSLKYSTHIVRPDESNDKSFPSGHTAEAFVAATFLHKEYGHISVWYSIGGYTAATAVGCLRILNNRHWLPDVLIGAGIGVLSTNIVYLTHQHRWGKKRHQTTLLPTFGKVPGVYFCYRFK